METLGLKTIEILLVKRDFELEDRVMKARNIPEDSRSRIQAMLRYNCFTISQYADITGLAVSSITNMTRPIYSKKHNEMVTHLDFCYPHADLNSFGKKFIVRNEKSEKYLP